MMRAGIAWCQARPKAVISLCALLLAVQIGPWWYSSIDSASYLSMARSLAKGAGPTNLGSPLWWYSPGYPALISPLFLFDERPFFAIAVLQWMLAIGLMLGVYVWARQVVPEAAVWIAALTVINHGFWIHFRRPLSEIAFMCALIWVVNCLAALGKASKTIPFAARLTTGALLTALLCIIRPVGVMLVPAVVVWGYYDARARRLSWPKVVTMSLATALAAGVPVTLFVVHERTAAAELNGRSYLDEFHEAAQSPLENYSHGLQVTISEIGRVCIPGLFKSHGTPGDWTDVNMLIHVPFFLLVSCGWLRWVRRQNDLFAWLAPFYVLLIAAHAIDTGARLLLPLLPALFVAVWLAAERMRDRRQNVVAVCLILQLLVAGSYWLGVDSPRARRDDRMWPAVDVLVRQIATEPAPASAKNLPGNLLLMLEVALDRPVAPESSRAQDAQWCLTLRDEAGPDGFARVDEVNELTLWRRERAAIASASFNR
jgi:hypothetical protein